MREEKSIMDRKPMATIIIPVYNAQAYLEKCLDSALQQTYDNYEINMRGMIKARMTVSVFWKNTGRNTRKNCITSAMKKILDRARAGCVLSPWQGGSISFSSIVTII